MHARRKYCTTSPQKPLKIQNQTGLVTHSHQLSPETLMWADSYCFCFIISHFLELVYMTGRVMTLAASCQHTLLIPERRFPSKSRIPAILFPTPSPRGTGSDRRRSAAAAWRLERQPDLGTAPDRGEPGNSRPGAAPHPPPAGARPIPRHGGSGLAPFRPRGQLRGPRKRAPNEQQSAAGPQRLRFPERGALARATASTRSPAPNKARPRGPCSAPARPTWCL